MLPVGYVLEKYPGTLPLTDEKPINDIPFLQNVL